MGKRQRHSKQDKKSNQQEETNDELDRKGVQVVHESDLMNARDDDDSVSSESDDDELLLEGELVRNPDVSSSSSDEDDDDEEEEEDKKPAAASPASSAASKKRQRDAPTTNDNKNNKKQSKSQTKKKKKKKEDDLTNVEFIFCDTDEKYWHGCKALLQNSAIVYQKHASTWVDWTLEQVVGTVCSTSQAYSEEDAVFGFASMVDTTIATKTATASKEESNQERTKAMEYVQQYVLQDCPAEYAADMKKLVTQSNEQQAPLFLFLHGRMINLPLEIVLVLHEQLWLDWEFSIQQDKEQTSGKKKKQNKNQQNAATASIVSSTGEPRILRLAPCTMSGGNKNTAAASDLLYRYYDDELLAQRALVRYTVKGPRAYSQEESQLLQVMVLTPQEYRAAIQDLKALVGSG